MVSELPIDKKKLKQIPTYLNTSQFNDLKKAAKKEKKSISAYIRSALKIKLKGGK